MARVNRSQARDLKHQGTLATAVYRGRTDNIRALINQCWDLYHTDQHSRFEDSMRRLRKLSPHHSREIYDEIDALATAQEEGL
ncbi:hypothetical protein Ep4_019 [Pseudomonas phage Ep4]|uniref:Uncharacterized protein n=1 Tax=Pseudomonas phage Ep4 TaxID=3057492 RepID=A0AAU9E6V9_9CAUD|nr:hypothetical protein Ep4_019 [Pseudomonas phage Ep4]